MYVDKINPITIQKATSSQNDLGNPIGDTYIDITTTLAAYETKYGRSFNAAEEIHKVVECRFTIWFDPNMPINENMYVLFNGARFLILATNDVNGLHRELQLLCKKAV